MKQQIKKRVFYLLPVVKSYDVGSCWFSQKNNIDVNGTPCRFFWMPNAYGRSPRTSGSGRSCWGIVWSACSRIIVVFIVLFHTPKNSMYYLISFLNDSMQSHTTSLTHETNIQHQRMYLLQKS